MSEFLPDMECVWVFGRNSGDLFKQNYWIRKKKKTKLLSVSTSSCNDAPCIWANVWMERIACSEEICFIYQRSRSVQNEDEVSSFAFLCHQNIMVFNEDFFRHPQSFGTVNQPARAACCCICVCAVLLHSVIAPTCCLSLPFLVFLLLSNSEWLPMQLPLCCALFFPVIHTQSQHRGEVPLPATGCCPLWGLKQDTGVVQGFSCHPHHCIQCVSKGCHERHLFVTPKLTSVQLGTAAQSCLNADGGTA